MPPVSYILGVVSNPAYIYPRSSPGDYRGPTLSTLLSLKGHATLAIGPRRSVGCGNSMLEISHPFPTTAASFVVFRSVTHFPHVEAVNLYACGTRLLQLQNTTQNTMNTTESSSSLSLTYEQCLVECGTGMGDIDWAFLSQTFGAWFLPWISLMFQIPFGAERKSWC